MAEVEETGYREELSELEFPGALPDTASDGTTR